MRHSEINAAQARLQSSNAEQVDVLKRDGQSSNVAAMYAVLALLSGAFFLLFFNKFSGLRSGNGEFGGGAAYLSGIVPYRDYFTTGPPMNLFKSALLLKIFGRALIVSRTAGVIERVLIAGVLFRWLMQIFKPSHALLAGLITIILSAGDQTDPIASYNHDSIFYAMASGLAASFILARKQERSAFLFTAGVSGAFAALSLMTKQTIGLGIFFAIAAGTGVLVFKLDGLKRSLTWLGMFLLGALAPLAGLTIYLIRLRALPSFIAMLFVKGPAAKAAHPSDFFYRELLMGFENFIWVMGGLLCLLLSWQAIRRSVGRTGVDKKEPANVRDGQLHPGMILLAGGTVIGCATALAYTNLPVLHSFSKIAIYYTFIATTILFFAYIVKVFYPGMTRHQAQCILFCAISWSVAFMLSLSWPAFEAMLLPGLGFLIAATLNGVQTRSLPYVYGVLALMLFMQTREKLDLPFTFDYQNDAKVRFASEESTQPQLRGMRFSKEAVELLDGTTAIIQKHTSAKDTIFTYPEMGLFYSLSGRNPATVSWSHNIDVLNDNFAYEEAERLKSARPAVIVYYRLSEQQLRNAEIVWRGGRPSGQRYLISAIEGLVSDYQLAGSYHLAPGDPAVMVYVRP